MSARSTPKSLCVCLTLIFPSILTASCSYNHIDTVDRCCKSLNMKLIGGRRTFPLPPPPPPPRPVIANVGSFAASLGADSQPFFVSRSGGNDLVGFSYPDSSDNSLDVSRSGRIVCVILVDHGEISVEGKRGLGILLHLASCDCLRHIVNLRPPPSEHFKRPCQFGNAMYD